jgi:hypothetical protein
MVEEPVAVCGIDCAHCPLLKASFGDTEAAEHLAGWWRSEGWLKENEGAAEVLERGPHCLGCRGDRSAHWAANCWILKCCVDDKAWTSATNVTTSRVSRSSSGRRRTTGTPKP